MKVWVHLSAIGVAGALGCAGNPSDAGPQDAAPDAVVVSSIRDASESKPDANVRLLDAATPSLPDAFVVDAAGDDGGVGANDGGSDAGGEDAGPDATPVDAGADAPLDLDSGSASPVITIDGLVSATEWVSVDVARNSAPSTWTDANRLESVRAFTDGVDLYVAVEGAVEATNAIVMYVDGSFGEAVGVGDLATLTDSAGALDSAISAAYQTPENFYADAAWGTHRMDVTAEGFDPLIGWRDIASPADFAWIAGEEGPSVCSTGACETRIPLTQLGASSGDVIALFVRITNGDGGAFDNGQTLPMDDPSDPQAVGTLLMLPVP